MTYYRYDEHKGEHSLSSTVFFSHNGMPMSDLLCHLKHLQYINCTTYNGKKSREVYYLLCLKCNPVSKIFSESKERIWLTKIAHKTVTLKTAFWKKNHIQKYWGLNFSICTNCVRPQYLSDINCWISNYDKNIEIQSHANSWHFLGLIKLISLILLRGLLLLISFSLVFRLFSRS